ncbi:MAG TPA: hypothetical protein PK205_18620 [Promineifilum sp.]|nr:hypothetical protein [Promineifilum sp.]
MTTIPQNDELLKHLVELLQAHRSIFRQERVFQRVAMLVIAELVVFARHTVTQLLMGIGHTEGDWSGWYRLFSRRRFPYDEASGILFGETLRHVARREPYVVGGDGTQTRRSSCKMEGAHWLHDPQSPVFKRGIHIAQRWFNGSWLAPAEEGYSRAVPLRWLPTFTEKSRPQATPPCKEWEAAVAFLVWVKQQLVVAGRAGQQVLMVADGHYDTLPLWQHLPDGVILLARSARNRVLWHLPGPQARPNRRYGERASGPADYWREPKGWRSLHLQVRGKERHLQVKVAGPFLRKGAPGCPLFLIIVRGKDNRHTRRQPLPFLVNAWRDASGTWRLPLPVEQLLFWAWQRWELEVAHRELKSNFGLGNKQCWNPVAAVASVQWSAWVYALLLLAGYRCWGLTGAPAVPTRWWSGSRRWSLNTLWRGYRAALWGTHQFMPITPESWITKGDLRWIQPALRHAAFAAARS